MLFYQDLANIVFTRYQLMQCDEIIILSGYVGPSPIQRLNTLPLKSTVIYGMYGCDGIQESLHNALIKQNSELENVSIKYSTIPVHSKCYIWRDHGKVVHALIGSANFSENGLTTPFKEVLAETTYDTFNPLNQYLQMVLGSAIDCEQGVSKRNKRKAQPQGGQQDYDPDVCSMPLFILDKTGNPFIPASSGINWGMAKLAGSHVNINDAYIRIGSDLLEHYPDMFPKKQTCPSEGQEVHRVGHRHNDIIEIIWDDGTEMKGLLEGSIPKKDPAGNIELYPKQLASCPKKSELGNYLRQRLGVQEGVPITLDDLDRYGRRTIDVSLQGEGIYYFDFSVN